MHNARRPIAICRSVTWVTHVLKILKQCLSMDIYETDTLGNDTLTKQHKNADSYNIIWSTLKPENANFLTHE